MQNDSDDFIHKEFPKKFARDDFWSQIKRTVNGEPVSDDDIHMIITQITDHLKLSGKIHLLDIGCGNAALASRLFPFIGEYTGVDFSSYLLEIANEYFKKGDHIHFFENDALNFVKNCIEPDIYNRALIYGCMSYLGREDFSIFLKTLHSRFVNLEQIFIGNIPDISRSKEFFENRNIKEFETDDEKSAIGIWWGTEEISLLSKQAGFIPKILKMPETFYGQYYRYDLSLQRI